MPAILRRRRRRGLNKKRNSLANRPQPTAPVTIVSGSAAGSVLTLTFNQAVTINGVPKYTTDVAGADAVSIVQTTPTTVQITFDAAIAIATEVRIPYEEPSIRNSSGGFVGTNVFAL